jgi:hypothetical protein
MSDLSKVLMLAERFMSEGEAADWGKARRAKYEQAIERLKAVDNWPAAKPANCEDTLESVIMGVDPIVLGVVIARSLDRLGELGEQGVESARYAILHALLGDSAPYVEEGVRLMRPLLEQAHKAAGGR